MLTFDHSFTVPAPLHKVVRFHSDTRVLKQLTPPPAIMQVHKFEPLAEGSIADFTIWFGPIPIHWVAVHTNVNPEQGFIDTQQDGPMAHWVHTHSFTSEGDNLSRVNDHIEYQHHPGIKGLLTRLLFAKPGLQAMFTYRKMITRREIAKM